MLKTVRAKRYILFLLGIVVAACVKVESPDMSENGEIEIGSKVEFVGMLPDAVAELTKSTQSEWEDSVKQYKPVNHKYTFAVNMFKEGDSSSYGQGVYVPLRTIGIGDPAIEGYDGTLSLATGSEPLYWQNNTDRWGFLAEANNTTLSQDQSSQDKWLAMDHLKGHSYLPIWEDGKGTSPETPMFFTSKEWYSGNKSVKDLEGLMVSSNEDYKKIPLYMQHQRAWITVILKAGEGVRREDLQYLKGNINVDASIFSYQDGEILEVDRAWSSEYFIDYSKDKNGPAQNHVSTTRYDAIVMPHNYALKKDDEAISSIYLSNQKFTFHAGNDLRYVDGDPQEAAKADEAYNLEAGKHLTITATLSRESRKVLITSWIEDWTEVATSTICDDYGQNGDPVVIKNRDDLVKFLSDPKLNRQGSVGIIQPMSINLDTPSESLPDVWGPHWNLNATLNLAGCMLITGHQIFEDMSISANIVNGTIMVSDDAVLDHVIGHRNEGSIERVSIITSGEGSNARARVAGFVGWNQGTIYQCTSALPVVADSPILIEGTQLKGYIGGIAAISQSKENSSMAVIDGCVVNAPVDGVPGIKGGGIVGIATGRVSNNTFEYGITVSQDYNMFKNIIHSAGSGAELRVYDNRWPTLWDNPIGGVPNPNNYDGVLYHGTINSQEELEMLLKSGYNAEDKKYRISESFTVSSSNDPSKDWTHGMVDPEGSIAESIVKFSLDGNGMTIRLTGDKIVRTTDGFGPGDGTVTEYETAPMLFNIVDGEIKNLTIYLEKSLVASPSIKKDEESVYSAEDAIAPLAYAIRGGQVSNVKVKAHRDENGQNDVFVQAATPAGLIVWAYNGAVISNCKVKLPVRMWLPETMGAQSRHYAGGLVACAARADIQQCEYLGQDNSICGSALSSTSTDSPNYYYGGIVGGTSDKNSEMPSLLITDCISWFTAQRAEVGAEDNSSRAAIIAYSCYAGPDNVVVSGMDPDRVCEGNWWPLSAIGAHTWADNLNEERVIGRRNSISPTYDTDYDKDEQ